MRGSRITRSRGRKVCPARSCRASWRWRSSPRIHKWSPAAHVERIDTVFRAPLIADEPCVLTAVVTDVDTDTGVVELDVSVKNEALETRVFGMAKVRFR